MITFRQAVSKSLNDVCEEIADHANKLHWSQTGSEGLIAYVAIVPESSINELFEVIKNSSNGDYFEYFFDNS